MCNNRGDVHTLVENYGDNGDVIRAPYNKLSVAFFYSLQTLHDKGENWKDGGLSYKGKEVVRKIRETWAIKYIPAEKNA